MGRRPICFELKLNLYLQTKSDKWIKVCDLLVNAYQVMARCIWSFGSIHPIQIKYFDQFESLYGKTLAVIERQKNMKQMQGLERDLFHIHRV